MTPEAQRIAIAEACGWEFLSGDWPFTTGLPKNWQGAESRMPLPDYLNDLNAMAEAEKTLTAEQARSYDKALQRVGYQKHLAGSFWLWHMTAAERAEAFLKTLNLWTE